MVSQPTLSNTVSQGIFFTETLLKIGENTFQKEDFVG